MATQKPISTISYNTEAFLVEKLNSLVDGHIIQCWTYIKHIGEDGDKDHIHVRVEPNKKLDPMDLSELLKEYTLDNPKPLGCRPWRPSKEEDWFLYAIHDKNYLALKYNGGDNGEKIPYSDSDIKCSDGYDLEVAMVRARSAVNHSTVNIATRVRDGEHPINLIAQGESPYIVNAIVRALSENDYQAVTEELHQIKCRYSLLLDFIEDNLGFIPRFDESNNLILPGDFENDD